MPDAAETPVPAAEESFAAYVQRENAAEQAARRGDAPPPAVESETPPVVAETSGDLSSESAEAKPAEAETAEEKEQRARDEAGKFKKEPVQARIDREVYKRKALEKKAAELEAKVREYEARQAAPQGTVKPQDGQVSSTQPSRQGYTPPQPLEGGKFRDIDGKVYDFSGPEETWVNQFSDRPDPYMAAQRVVARYEATLAQAHLQQQQTQQQYAQQMVQKANEVIEAGREKYQDFDTALETFRELNFPSYLQQIIAKSPQGQDLVYLLGTHADDARAVAAQSPEEAVFFLGQLAAQYATPAQAGSGASLGSSRSKAKPLIKPVSSAPVIPVDQEPDPDKYSQAEWNRIMNSRDRARAKAMRG